MIPIVEIFKSIEGEGSRSGKVCTFIRTAGCNCRCKRCDTTYSYEGGTMMSVDEIMKKVEELDCKTITLTGGEPLLHKEVYTHLLTRLLEQQYDVNIETNGSIDLSVCDRKKHQKLMFTMDWKAISTDMSDKMLISNLPLLEERDVLKFVVETDEDLDQMKQVITDNDLKCHIFVSPIFGEIEMSHIVDYMKENKLYNVRLQCQLHKIIYPIDMRGV